MSHIPRPAGQTIGASAAMNAGFFLHDPHPEAAAGKPYQSGISTVNSQLKVA